MNDYGGLIMPSVESVKMDLEALGTTGQEEILAYLEEVIVLGSFATEVTNEVKENRFSKGKVCPCCGHAERPSLTLHVHHATIAKKTLKSGYYILNV